MAIVYNLYSDPQCTTHAKSGAVGVLGLFGDLANRDNWIAYNYHLPPNIGKIYKKQGITAGRAIVSAGLRWFSLHRMFNGDGLFSGQYLLTDTKYNGATDTVKNCFFTAESLPSSIVTYDSAFHFLQIWGGGTYNSSDNQSNSIGIFLGEYGQTPPPTDGQRTAWNYYTGTYDFRPEMGIAQKNNSYYSNIGFFKISLPWGENGETIKFIAICANYNDDGNFPASDSNVEKGGIMLIPENFWVDATKTPTPYIGPQSADSAATSFIPERGLIHDSILSRDLTGITNPYGFNSGALKLCKITSTNYGLLCSQIFNGSSGSILNQLSQDVAALTGGNEHRKTDEVQAIQSGIMAIHLIPDIATIATGATYNIQTIAGYKISGLVPVQAAPVLDTSMMITHKTQSIYISGSWKSFADFEPYTTITLRIPYVGNVNIPPSVLYGNSIQLVYHLDLFSGVLSVDVVVHDITNGNQYIFTTLQANCAVSLPIAGTSAAGAPLSKIASGIVGMALSGVGNSANSIFSIISGLQDTKKSVPFGNFAQSNISAYFDSRHCYLIIQSVSPANAETFLTDKGYVAHLSGIVSDFAGVGQEMHCIFENVDLTSLSKLTEQEKRDVETMLKSGVHIRRG